MSLLASLGHIHQLMLSVQLALLSLGHLFLNKGNNEGPTLRSGVTALYSDPRGRNSDPISIIH